MKKYFVLLLAVMLACGSSAAFAVEYGAEGYETHGRSESDAWEISSAETLAKARDDINANKVRPGSCFKLTDDIDLTDVRYESWIPIDLPEALDLTFDGNYHTVTVSIVDTRSALMNKTHTGLFGMITKGTIKNLSVSGTVRASTGMLGCDVGGIAGIIYGGTIENCNFDGTVKATARTGTYFVNAGGIVGNVEGWLGNVDVKIMNCKVGSNSTATISSSATLNNSNAGGIVGYLFGKETDRITGNYIRVYIEDAAYKGMIYGFQVGNCIISGNTEEDPDAGSGNGGNNSGNSNNGSTGNNGNTGNNNNGNTGNNTGNNNGNSGNNGSTGSDGNNTSSGNNTANNSGGSSDSGGGGCNSFGSIGVMLMALIAFRKR